MPLNSAFYACTRIISLIASYILNVWVSFLNLFDLIYAKSKISLIKKLRIFSLDIWICTLSSYSFNIFLSCFLIPLILVFLSSNNSLILSLSVYYRMFWQCMELAGLRISCETMALIYDINFRSALALLYIIYVDISMICKTSLFLKSASIKPFLIYTKRYFATSWSPSEFRS